MSERILRVNSEIQKAISYIIANEIKNPLIKGLITVTKVDTTPDLRFARVYVSMINAKSNKGNLARLKKCSGFIRSAIARRVNLRVTPELIFLFDESIEYGSRIDAIIDKITKDMKKD